TTGTGSVTLHTSAGVGPPTTGPGACPGGEIRGALFAAGDNCSLRLRVRAALPRRLPVPIDPFPPTLPLARQSFPADCLYDAGVSMAPQILSKSHEPALLAGFGFKWSRWPALARRCTIHAAYAGAPVAPGEL